MLNGQEVMKRKSEKNHLNKSVAKTFEARNDKNRKRKPTVNRRKPGSAYPSVNREKIFAQVTNLAQPQMTRQKQPAEQAI